MSDLDLALLELKISLDKFAEAFVAAVARDLKRQVDALTVPLACPKTDPHDAHTWRFRDGVVGRACPGVTSLPVAQCPDDPGPHPAHDWFTIQEGRLTRCPGVPTILVGDGQVTPSRRGVLTVTDQCTVQGAHASHDTEAGHCHGRIRGKTDQGTLSAQVHPCPAEAEHSLHTWIWSGLNVWCRGRACFPKAQERPCPRILMHDAHVHSVPIDEDRSVTYRCPGRGPLVPAGPDRHA